MCDRKQSTEDAGIRFLLLSSPGPQSSAALGCLGLFFKVLLKARGMTSLFIRKKKKSLLLSVESAHACELFFFFFDNSGALVSQLSSALLMFFTLNASCTGPLFTLS